MNKQLKTALGALAVLALAVAAYERNPSSNKAPGEGAADGDTRLYMGQPKAGIPVQVLDNPGFVVGYVDALKQPLWVAYQAKPVADPSGPERPWFEADPRTQARVSYHDYKCDRWTRGHLAPNFVISRLYGRAAQEAAFLMSNISPQAKDFNSGAWQRLEELEVDEWARQFEQLWVVTGPVFSDRPKPTCAGIPIPDAFFRVLVDLDGNKPRAIAFLIPQSAPRTAPLGDYVVSIDAIEQATGLDLFADMNDAQEAKLESSVADDRWKINTLGTRPGRYN